MGLKEYHQKRDFEETSEPKGRVVSRQKGPLRFVVQKHEASHLHYDFRLEVDGVLKSWAVPKGPSMKPADKRLAIQVEDHPFDYRTFEGTIPEGSYGAGTVMLWDEGTYHAIDASSRKESEQLMEEGLEEGRLQFVLDGEKLKGEFSLLRLKGQEKQWLLVKKKDKYATSEDITLEDRSVISQRSMEEIAGDQPAAKSPARKKKSREKAESASPKGIEQTNLPKNAKPMLATLVEAPFDRKDWIFETKWDGYRALAAVDKGKVDLYSRSFQSFNKRYKPVIDDLKNLKISALLDGEIVILDEEGRSSFQLVQNYQRTQTGNIIYYVFDLLYLEGYDIRHLPLIERKDLLKKIISPDWEHVKFCEHIEEKGIRYFEKAVKKGLEGIIAKNSQSPYKSGRSHDWLKIKGHYRQEAVICGFTEPKGTREKFGALVLGVYKNGILTYVGHTGSGFNRKQLANIHARLTPLIQSKCPFPETPKTRFPVTWVNPSSFAKFLSQNGRKKGLCVRLFLLILEKIKNQKRL